MKRSTLLLLGAAALLLFIYMYQKSKQAQQTQDQTTTGATGTNLNSIAPELVGGSTGPSIGPVLSTPIDITITSSAPPGSSNPVGNLQPVQPVNQMIGAPQQNIPGPWRMPANPGRMHNDQPDTLKQGG